MGSVLQLAETWGWKTITSGSGIGGSSGVGGAANAAGALLRGNHSDSQVDASLESSWYVEIRMKYSVF